MRYKPPKTKTPKLPFQASPSFISIDNDGPDIAASNYWASDYASHGIVCLSANAGAWRLQVPDGFRLDQLSGVEGVAITLGRYQGREAMEILFDDLSDAPFVLIVGLNQVVGAPPKADPSERRLTVWQSGPRRVADFPCRYRAARELPCLKPWNNKEAVA